jgi:glucan endo-1,3-alpha-glucosidase
MTLPIPYRSSIPGEQEADAELLHQYMELVGHHPNQFLYHGRALVSTFAGDQCKFGQATLAGAWRFARTALERVCPVSQHRVIWGLHLHDRFGL